MKLDDDKISATEFEEFMGSSTLPPKNLHDEVRGVIITKMTPTAFDVIIRLLSIHIVSALLTLTICPQFGFSLFGQHGIMHVFMKLGSIGCAIACGTFFMGTSLTLAGIILTPEAIKLISRHALLWVFTLVMLSIGALFCITGPTLTITTPFWILGGILGGFATIKGVARLRFQTIPK